jgi:hypothetical protein
MNEIFIFNTPIIHVRFASNFAIEKISQLLQDRGMNPAVAIERAYSGCQTTRKANLYLNNFSVYFDKEIMQKIYSFIAKKALFQEKILFGSNDQLIGMMQDVYNSKLSEKELFQIKHLAKANHYGIALVR